MTRTQGKNLLLMAMIAFMMMAVLFMPFTVAKAEEDDEGLITPFAAKSVTASCTASGRTVTYGGIGYFTKTESSLSISITLQRKSGSTWVYATGTSASGTNSNSISKSASASVTGGYYYRCYAVASASGTTKSAYSSQVWVP